MTKSSTRPGWWRTGRASRKLVCLGAVLGAVGALVHLGSYAWGHQIDAYALVWGLYFLVLEVIVSTGNTEGAANIWLPPRSSLRS